MGRGPFHLLVPCLTPLAVRNRMARPWLGLPVRACFPGSLRVEERLLPAETGLGRSCWALVWGRTGAKVSQRSPSLGWPAAGCACGSHFPSICQTFHVLLHLTMQHCPQASEVFCGAVGKLRHRVVTPRYLSSHKGAINQSENGNWESR